MTYYEKSIATTVGTMSSDSFEQEVSTKYTTYGYCLHMAKLRTHTFEGECLFPPPYFLASDMSILVTMELLQLNQLWKKKLSQVCTNSQMLCLTFAMGSLKLQ